MERTVRNLALSFAVAGLCWLGAVAQTGARNNPSNSTKADNGGKLTVSETSFVKKAAEANLAEIGLGKLAAERASSQDVKQFGQRMVDDHTKADDQLKQVASEEGVKLPDKLDKEDAATKARLEKLSGEQFDHAYMLDMVRDHTKDVSEFRTEAKTAKDPAVKNFASQTLPTLEDHLKQAKSIEPHTTRTMHKTTKSKTTSGV
jgi:putative membrane protein